MTTREVCGLLGDADLALVLHEQARRADDGAQHPADRHDRRRRRTRGRHHRRRGRGLPRRRAQAVRLGAEVLRTSTAGAAALAALSMRTRWAE